MDPLQINTQIDHYTTQPIMLSIQQTNIILVMTTVIDILTNTIRPTPKLIALIKLITLRFMCDVVFCVLWRFATRNTDRRTS